eukprot:Awhi_evm1s4204
MRKRTEQEIAEAKERANRFLSTSSIIKKLQNKDTNCDLNNNSESSSSSSSSRSSNTSNIEGNINPQGSGIFGEGQVNQSSKIPSNRFNHQGFHTLSSLGLDRPLRTIRPPLFNDYPRNSSDDGDATHDQSDDTINNNSESSSSSSSSRSSNTSNIEGNVNPQGSGIFREGQVNQSSKIPSNRFNHQGIHTLSSLGLDRPLRTIRPPLLNDYPRKCAPSRGPPKKKKRKKASRKKTTPLKVSSSDDSDASYSPSEDKTISRDDKDEEYENCSNPDDDDFDEDTSGESGDTSADDGDDGHGDATHDQSDDTDNCHKRKASSSSARPRRSNKTICYNHDNEDSDE